MSKKEVLKTKGIRLAIYCNFIWSVALLIRGRMELDIPKLHKDDSLKRDTTFRTSLRCRERECRIIIEEECSISVVSPRAIKRLKLAVEPHPQPYTILG